jgi:hypothetical protein
VDRARHAASIALFRPAPAIGAFAGLLSGATGAAGPVPRLILACRNPPAAYRGARQPGDDPCGHTGLHLDHRVALPQVHTADLCPRDAALAGDGADQVASPDAISLAHV